MESNLYPQGAHNSLDHLHVLVVGAGWAGLAAAIELRLRGAKVKVLEAGSGMSTQGDVIMLPPNATRIVKKWADGDVLKNVCESASFPDAFIIADASGKVWLTQELMVDYGGFPNVMVARSNAQLHFYKYATSLGVEFLFNKRTTSFFETESSAGVLVGDEELAGDIVLAGDGVRSKARSLITNREVDKPQNSGFAVYRSWFPLDKFAANSMTRHIAEKSKDHYQVWIAENAHAIVTTNVKAKAATVFLTRKDPTEMEENWTTPGNKQDMIDKTQSWDPLLTEMIQAMPSEALLDHKLLWRDPFKDWVSKHGRVALLGDAAHPHLPTSGNGGAQAIEDGPTVATLLERTKDVGLALRAYARLRYERTSLTQRMGWEQRHIWHQTPWDEVSKNPDALKFEQPHWLYGCDAGEYASSKALEVFTHLQTGSPFASTNVPEGHVHEDWTVEGLLAFEGRKAAEIYRTRSNST